jgi:hypothetical protein
LRYFGNFQKLKGKEEMRKSTIIALFLILSTTWVFSQSLTLKVREKTLLKRERYVTISFTVEGVKKNFTDVDVSKGAYYYFFCVPEGDWEFDEEFAEEFTGRIFIQQDGNVVYPEIYDFATPDGKMGILIGFEKKFKLEKPFTIVYPISEKVVSVGDMSVPENLWEGYSKAMGKYQEGAKLYNGGDYSASASVLFELVADETAKKFSFYKDAREKCIKSLDNILIDLVDKFNSVVSTSMEPEDKLKEYDSLKVKFQNYVNNVLTPKVNVLADTAVFAMLSRANSYLEKIENKIKTEKGRLRSIYLAGKRINCLADEGEYIWIGTDRDGLVKLRKSTGDSIVYTTSNSGLPDDYVRAIAIDKQGNKWIGTDRGLAKFDGVNWTVYNASNSGLPTNWIYAIAVDPQGNKWIGTYSGLVKFDGVRWTVYNTSNSGLPSDWVLAIAIDGQGNKWIGTSGGLAKFDGVNWTVYETSNSGLPFDNILAIAIDEQGNKWIGTGNLLLANGKGLVKFDGVNWTVYTTSNSGLPFNNVHAIAIDEQGNKWIGTKGGLAKFDGINWSVYNISNSRLPSDNILAIVIDEQGNKWIGTSGGLALFHESGIIISEKEKPTPKPKEPERTEERDIKKTLPPVITIISPRDGSYFTNTELTVQYAIKNPSGEPITKIRVLIDGKLLPQERGIMLKQIDEETGEITITAPQRDFELSLIAETKYSVSVPSTVKLYWRGDAFVIKPKLYILAIGVSKYKDKDLQLRFASKDATDFVEIMKLQKGLLFEDVIVKLLVDEQATKDNILDGLDWLERQTTSKDVAILFLAGHGLNDRANNFYFLPVDVEIEHLKRTGVAFSDIKNTVSAISGKSIVFVDACHSGNVFGGKRAVVDMTSIVNELTSAESGVVVFASSTGKQFSFEDPAWGNGAFTKALIEGLKGKADLLGKGKITINMLQAYISERVKELTKGKQTPTVVKPQSVPDFPIAIIIQK